MYANLLLSSLPDPSPNKTLALFQAEGERFLNGVSFVSVNVSLRQRALRLIECCQCLITHVFPPPPRRDAGIPSHLQWLCSVAAGRHARPCAMCNVQLSCRLLLSCLLRWVVLAQGEIIQRYLIWCQSSRHRVLGFCPVPRVAENLTVSEK